MTELRGSLVNGRSKVRMSVSYTKGDGLSGVDVVQGFATIGAARAEMLPVYNDLTEHLRSEGLQSCTFSISINEPAETQEGGFPKLDNWRVVQVITFTNTV